MAGSDSDEEMELDKEKEDEKLTLANVRAIMTLYL